MQVQVPSEGPVQLEEPSLALAQVQVQVLVLGQGPKLWLQAVGGQRRLRAQLQGRQEPVMTCRHHLLDMLSGAAMAGAQF